MLLRPGFRPPNGELRAPLQPPCRNLCNLAVMALYTPVGYRSQKCGGLRRTPTLPGGAAHGCSLSNYLRNQTSCLCRYVIIAHPGNDRQQLGNGVVVPGSFRPQAYLPIYERLVNKSSATSLASLLSLTRTITRTETTCFSCSRSPVSDGR